ncbi:demethylmenaquinone methyltransferase [Boudabousia liubingyangii]|nr:demethylmenaquinone methyltransferase [Boudabousia liubingyangii]
MTKKASSTKAKQQATQVENPETQDQVLAEAAETLAEHVDKTPERVASMFDSIAERYDLTNDLMTFGWDRVWRRAVRQAVYPQSGDQILDLAAGTGTSSKHLAAWGADVTACDFSEGMLARGRELHPDLNFVWGDAMDLPFEDNSFDAVTISFGLRNVADTKKAMSEMLRVVRPGGKLVICEFSRPVFSPFRAAYDAYLKTMLQVISRTVQENGEAYSYLADSILQWPDQDGLAHMLMETGWEDVEYRNLTGGIVALHRAVKGA